MALMLPAEYYCRFDDGGWNGEHPRVAIAVNGSFFNTHRMVSQYVANVWFREGAAELAAS